MGSLTWGWSKSSFTFFLIEGDFLLDQNFLLFLAEVIAFWNIENTGNYRTRKNINRDLRKINVFGISKPILSYICYPIILKLNLVVLGVNKKLLFALEFQIRPLFKKYWILKIMCAKNQIFQNCILSLKGHKKLKRPNSKF